MSDQPAAMTMGQAIEAMKQWATDQIGKHTGPILLGPGVTINDPDKYLNKQLATMGTYIPRSIMHTAAYMHLYKLKKYLENE